MERITLSDIEILGTSIRKLHIIKDDYGKVICLPLLWTIHLSNSGSIYSWTKKGIFARSTSISKFQQPTQVEKVFEEHTVSENTIDNYVGHFFNFLKHINETNKIDNAPSVHNTELISSRFINNYLNRVLPRRLNSINSLIAHQASIQAYFSFLYELEIKEIPIISIHRTSKQLMAEEDSRPKKINYVSKDERFSLMTNCSNQRDRLILRMGFEVGLRTEENRGLVLTRHKAKEKTNDGLLDLFDQLQNFPNKESFEFVLNGKFTKGKKTRRIYFKRELLIAMKRYHDSERLETAYKSNFSEDTLFIRMDLGGKGKSISKEHGSNLFASLREKCPHINQSLSYHDLRHTFATELYYSELQDPEGRETRSESAALIVVAERLGHNSTASTIRYIRLKQQMLMIEEM